MTYSQELIEKAQKDGLKIIEIAEIINVSQPWVSHVKQGKRQFAEEHVIKLAEHMELNAEQELVKLQMDTAKSEKERAIWAKLLKTLIATSALVSASASAAIANCVQCILC